VKAAKYQIALADAQRSSDAPYDQRTTQVAVEEFKEFVAVYPDAELSDKAKDKIGELRSKEAENNFLIGRYYEKRKEYTAAKIYYDTVVKEYKNTPWAVKALEQVRAIELKRQKEK
jgi:outer membrane protein assembly factor BamD